MILNFLNKKQYNFIDILGQSGIAVLVYNGSIFWLGLIIPLSIAKHLIKRLEDFYG